MSKLKLLLEYFKKKFLILIFGVIALVICDISQLFLPQIVGSAIDMLAYENSSYTILFKPVFLIITISIVIAVLRYIWRTIIYGFTRFLERDLRNRLYESVLRHKISWHYNKTQGDLMALATNDIEAIRMAMGFGLVSLIDAIVLGAVSIYFMLSISSKLTIVALFPLPIISLLTVLLSKKIYTKTLDIQKNFGNLTELVREQLSGIKLIKAMGLQNLAVKNALDAGITYQKKNIKLSFISGLFFPFLTLLTNLALALVVFYGGKEVIFTKISTGDFVAFISYLGLMTWPMMALGLTFSLLQQGFASLERLKQVIIFETPLDKNAFSNIKQPAINFNHLTFYYPARNKPAVFQLNCTFGSNDFIGITGPTGSGKSTLVSLILGIYEPPKNSLRIGGINFEDWSLNELRSHFSYVPQDIFIFSGTIAENIAFGKHNAAQEEIFNAAQAACLDLDVFPDRLDTLLGEKGMSLSGGQKQRLSLARALLVDPEILILDDTLSAVDAKIEDKIFKNIKRLRKGRLTIVITHRVNSLASLDRLLVLDDGHLTGYGSFKELLKTNNYLKQIYQLANVKQILDV